MQTLAFDGRTGASGDMLLGALLASGASADALSPVEDALDVEYRIDRVTKNGIRATTVDVLVEDDGGHEHADDGGHEHADDGGHEHADDDAHEHADDDAHPHEHAENTHDHAEGHGPHRTYQECRDLVEGMGLPDAVEADANAIFRVLGEAESRVHGTDLEDTHFHEVGADDAIADVVGVALLLDDLAPDRVVTTPVAAGGGEVTMSHGTYPVPTPAVTYIAESASWDLVGGPVDTELLTPTGAAILAHVAEGVDSIPAVRVDGSGYGAGSKSFEEYANVVRATVGEAKGRLLRDDVRVLETNLDDATPEVLGGLHERLRAVGARDVTVVPTAMKKSRPGHLVQVVVKPEDVQAVARRLAEETGTLGVRETPAAHRWVAERAFETVELTFDGETYEVTVKVATDDAGEVYDVSAEYDDAVQVAELVDRPIRDVIARAEAEYRSR